MPLKSIPTTTATGTMIWRHILEPNKANMPADLARYVLQMDFKESDQRRMAVLSRKAENGKLTARERSELEEYLRVADALALMQSKARLSLKRRAEEP